MSLPQIFLNLHHEVGVVLEQELFLAHLTLNINVHASVRRSSTHPAKIDLNKKWLPKQQTIQNFNIDALKYADLTSEERSKISIFRWPRVQKSKK